MALPTDGLGKKTDFKLAAISKKKNSLYYKQTSSCLSQPITASIEAATALSLHYNPFSDKKYTLAWCTTAAIVTTMMKNNKKVCVLVFCKKKINFWKKKWDFSTCSPDDKLKKKIIFFCKIASAHIEKIKTNVYLFCKKWNINRNTGLFSKNLITLINTHTTITTTHNLIMYTHTVLKKKDDNFNFVLQSPHWHHKKYPHRVKTTREKIHSNLNLRNNCVLFDWLDTLVCS